MKRITYLLMVILVSLCSCSTVRHTASTEKVDSKVVSFTVADLNVSTQKVSKTKSWGFNPFKSVSISTEKANTTAKLLQEYNADVLIEPQYIVEKHGFLRGGSVTVIGFPATYSNFHKMTPEEAKMLGIATKGKQKATPHKKWILF